ncbi:Unknown protein, partial [Striga hermonthica]
EPGHQELPKATVVAHFRDYHPEKFSGQGDPRIVDEWVQGLEMIFELIRGKYYHLYYREDMKRQFLALRQGTRSVDEYEREFTRLRTFVPDLVGTEAKRAHRFTDGLHPAVRHNIVGHAIQTYARAVAIAQEVDASIRREAVQTPAQTVAQPAAKPKVAQPSTKKNKRKFKGGPDDRRNRQRQKTIPECLTCGKHHRGECLVGKNVCFFCRQPGHCWCYILKLCFSGYYTCYSLINENYV